MTVSYSKEVSTNKGFGCFLKLLRRWKGSIYKLIWPDVSLFLALYYAFAFIYRVILTEDQRNFFEDIVFYCDRELSTIPLSFVLGFYISLIIKRWWDQFIAIPIPDSLAVFVSSLLHGQDERGRMMRRTIMRYVVLSQAMVLSNISPSVKKRFPTYDHLVEFGLMTENEKELLEKFKEYSNQKSEFWMPITWAASIVTRARKEGRLQDDFALKTLIDELNKFRGVCVLLMHYDTLCIPLVYTQVVTLVVYSYFGFNIMGAQWTDREDKQGFTNDVNYYFPAFITMQLFFYVGWLKVAEALINPFGEDDDDFELNFMIDRDWRLSYFIADEMHHKHPTLLKDQYWDRQLPKHLPYFNKVKKNKKIKYEEPPRASTALLYAQKDSDNTRFWAYRNLRQSLGALGSNLRRRFLGREHRSHHIDPPAFVPFMAPETYNSYSKISDKFIPRSSKSSKNLFDSSSSEDFHAAMHNSEFEVLRRERNRMRMERNERQMQTVRHHSFTVDRFNNLTEVPDPSLFPRQIIYSELRISSRQTAEPEAERGTIDTERGSQLVDAQPEEETIDAERGSQVADAQPEEETIDAERGSQLADAQPEEETDHSQADGEKRDESKDENLK